MIMKKMDLRVVKTLASIDNALMQELKEKQFQNVTVDSICKKAQINRTTFYKHYKDKYDLLDNYVDRFLNEFDAHCSKLFIKPSITDVIDCEENKEGYLSTTNFVIKNKDLCKILWEQSGGRNLLREMIIIVARNYYQSSIENDKALLEDEQKLSMLDLFSRLLAATYIHSLRWWVINDPLVDEKEYNRILSDLLRKGLFETFKDLI